MQTDFDKLENTFHQIKVSHNNQAYNELIEQLQYFIDQYRQVLEVPEQVILAHAFELQLKLYQLTEQHEKAAAAEKVLDDEFLGIHRIGKQLEGQNDTLAPYGRALNISAELLDMERLKTLAIKQKGTTKPKLVGWILKIIGFALIGTAAWLFTKQWVWTPLIVGIVGVLFSTIGTQVSHVVNRFLTTVAFNAGTIIPGVITHVDDKRYEAVFIAPLNIRQNQPKRWGIKKISFNKMAGSFSAGEQIAGVCILNQPVGDYHPDFIPSPVCLAYRSEIIPYQAKLTISEHEWQCLNKVIEAYRQSITDSLFIVDHNLQRII